METFEGIGHWLIGFWRRELLRQRLVGTITKHAVGALLAGAEIDWTVFGGGVGNGCKSRAFMGTIAEWLCLALAARAPVVSLASFDGDSDGGSLSDFRFVHFDGSLIFVRRTCVEAPSYISSHERPAIFIRERRSQIFKGGLPCLSHPPGRVHPERCGHQRNFRKCP